MLRNIAIKYQYFKSKGKEQIFLRLKMFKFQLLKWHFMYEKKIYEKQKK